jgi:GDPmannose 4,6-dehydratase
MKAFITGITGQDGSYLAEHLLAEGWRVTGLVRGQDNPKVAWLRSLVPTAGERLRLINGDLTDDSSLRAALFGSEPDVIFNLGAISSPGMAWGQPVHTAEVTGLGALRLLQATLAVAPRAHFVQAATIAHHGPYGAAKLFAQTCVADFRERGMHASCAVFGGHHSPRRGLSFFSRKVTKAVAGIADGRLEKLPLGSLQRRQDWGWAEDFVTVLPRLACDLAPGDYVMSTGHPHSVERWVQLAFAHVDLDWRDYVTIDPLLGNVTDVPVLSAAPSSALNWVPRQDLTGLIATMVDADRV